MSASASSLKGRMWQPAVELALKYGNEILIEKFIRGKEVQVGILGDRALGAIEIVPKTGIL